MKETRFKDTEVGRIPEDWDIIKLGDVVDISSGSTPSRYIESNFTGSTCWLTSGELKTHYIYDTKEKISETAASQLRLYPKGTVVIAMYGLEADGVRGTCSILNVPATISQACMAFVNFRQIDNEYFYYWYTSNGNLIGTRYAQGTKQQNLSPEIIKSIKIPVPKNISEQKRVATALSNVDALIAELGRLIEKKRAIKQGAMQQLLTGKKRLKGFSEPWVELKIRELGELTGAGVDKLSKPNESKVRLLNYLDVFHRDYIYNTELQMEVTANDDKLAKCNVLQGDVFFTPSSEMAYDIALSAVAMETMPHVCYSYHIYRLRFNIDIDLKYKAYMFKSQYFYNQANLTCEGSGKRYVISLAKFRELSVTIPSSTSEQSAIASVLSSIDEEISALEAKKVKYEQIKQGMMQQLLTGKIRLVETAVKTNVTSANVHFRRSVLAAEIAERLYEEPTFGHVKMEKMLFLTERLCHIDIGSHYHRDAAGPYDNRALRSIDSQLRKQKWFDVKRTEKGNRYVPMQNCGKHKTYFDKYYSSVLPTFEKIIDTFKTQNTERCEIVATLYSAWEDLLHSNKSFTDADIVNEVLNNWHESKKRISQDRWLNAIQWMRENGFAPNV